MPTTTGKPNSQVVSRRLEVHSALFIRAVSCCLFLPAFQASIQTTSHKVASLREIQFGAGGLAQRSSQQASPDRLPKGPVLSRDQRLSPSHRTRIVFGSPPLNRAGNECVRELSYHRRQTKAKSFKGQPSAFPRSVRRPCAPALPSAPEPAAVCGLQSGHRKAAATASTPCRASAYHPQMVPREF